MPHPLTLARSIVQHPHGGICCPHNIANGQGRRCAQRGLYISCKGKRPLVIQGRIHDRHKAFFADRPTGRPCGLALSHRNVRSGLTCQNAACSVDPYSLRLVHALGTKHPHLNRFAVLTKGGQDIHSQEEDEQSHGIKMWPRGRPHAWSSFAERGQRNGQAPTCSPHHFWLWTGRDGFR